MKNPLPLHFTIVYIKALICLFPKMFNLFQGGGARQGPTLGFDRSHTQKHTLSLTPYGANLDLPIKL